MPSGLPASAGLRIVFLGTSEFALPVLEALALAPDGVAAVITRPDRPAGRGGAHSPNNAPRTTSRVGGMRGGRELRPPPVKVASQRLGLAVHQPERVSRPEGIELLQSAGGGRPDLLVVAAFGEVLHENVLGIPRLGAINVHASLLPRYRGAAPIQRAILAGETVTGVTVQWMSKELDAGDIILQRSLAVGEGEDFGSLHARLAQLGAEAAVEAVSLIRRGEAPRIPQQAEDATLAHSDAGMRASYAPPIRREELQLDWTQPASQLVRTVRAFSPRPGARTSRHAAGVLRVLSAREAPPVAQVRDLRRPAAGRPPTAEQNKGVLPVPAPGRGLPGEVAELTAEGFAVWAGEGRVLVLRVHPAGRREMTASEYAQGYRLTLGEHLGSPEGRNAVVLPRGRRATPSHQ